MTQNKNCNSCHIADLEEGCLIGCPNYDEKNNCCKDISKWESSRIFLKEEREEFIKNFLNSEQGKPLFNQFSNIITNAILKKSLTEEEKSKIKKYAEEQIDFYQNILKKWSDSI